MMPSLRNASILAMMAISSGCSESTRSDGSGTLEGYLRTSAGEPVFGALIELQSSGLAIASSLSDSAGYYSVTGTVGIDYSVLARLPLGYHVVGDLAPWIAQDESALIPTLTLEAGHQQLNLTVQAIEEETIHVDAGAIDTAALGGGVTVEIDASGANGLVALKLETSSDTLPTGRQPISAIARLTIGPAGASQYRKANAAEVSQSTSSGGVVIAKVMLAITTTSLTSKIVLAPESTSQLFLYADATTTTSVDPRTGAATTVAVHSLTLDQATPVTIDFAAIDATEECDVPSQSLLEHVGDRNPLASRTPIVFIHGWQLGMLNCDDWKEYSTNSKPFEALIQAIYAAPELVTRYKPYVLRYATYRPVAEAGMFLASELDARALTEPVLVGHSMGGLVARALVANRGPSIVRALITLGTPHEGTGAADFANAGLWQTLMRPSVCGAFPPWVLRLVAAPIATSPGVQDLAVGSPFQSQIASVPPDPDRFFTFGGGKVWQAGPLSLAFRCALDDVVGSPNDSIVPLSSALPAASRIRTALPDFNHIELHGGHATMESSLISRVNSVLDGLSMCGSTPSRPSVNEFVMSGSIARMGGRHIDVTLNPIIIHNNPVSNLSEANFSVIENDCMLPFTMTSAEGSIGVDIAFVQDLSGSMSGAIAGVRSSVLGFAQDLHNRGIDVRIGAVGYSGFGAVPSSPASSACEYLGPVQDLTTAVAFQQHVANSWLAQGGCDNPENALEAIEYAHHNFAWRNGAARVYIDITDVSHHHSGTSCNGQGRCTDQALASIVSLVGETSTIHVVAPASLARRQTDGGLDPYELAMATGGKQLDLGSGNIDLVALGVADIIAQTVRITYESFSEDRAWHDVRIRATINGLIAELAPGVISYRPISPSLKR